MLESAGSSIRSAGRLPSGLVRSSSATLIGRLSMVATDLLTRSRLKKVSAFFELFLWQSEVLTRH